MYNNLTKGRAFPLAAKIYSQPNCFKSSHASMIHFLPFGSAPKPSGDSILPNLCTNGARHKVGSICLVNSVKFSTYLCYKTLEMEKLANSRPFSYGLLLRNGRHCCMLGSARTVSTFSVGKASKGSRVRGAGKQLPWLVSDSINTNSINEAKESGGGRKVKKVGQHYSQKESLKRSGKVSSKSSWEESVRRLEKPTTTESEPSSWQASVATISEKTSISAAEARKSSKNELFEMVGEQRIDYGRSKGKFEENDEEGGDDEVEVAIDDPRWDDIKHRFKGIVDVKAGSEKPEFRRWNKQESWGRKTWKEATQSTVPKIIGEGVYGVGPVLAALSAGRREFYALYVQEGLDLSSNNRKKKDKKGFEKVLKIAENVGLTLKEVSKHDLNMVVDNRPHQGLVLDASPLEMVKIKELDPISVEEGHGSLWVALDEVTDPQNVGAIIRSAYYFGASGIVLCAKNSAPLSGVVSKASAGSLELMELRYCKNMMQFLVSSAENGWRILGGSVSSKAIPLDGVVPGPPTILVLGSEGTGLRPLVERSCTELVRIPGSIPADITVSELDGETNGVNGEISGKEFQSFLAVESLNVSVAAGVLLHHLIGKNLEEP